MAITQPKLGAQTRRKYKALKEKHKEKKNKWAGEREAMEQQLRSLHKSRDFTRRGTKNPDTASESEPGYVPSLNLRGVGLSPEGLGVGAELLQPPDLVDGVPVAGTYISFFRFFFFLLLLIFLQPCLPLPVDWPCLQRPKLRTSQGLCL